MKRYKYEWFLFDKNTCEYSYLARYYDKDMDNIDEKMMNVIQKACKVRWECCHVFDITNKPEYANKECFYDLPPILSCANNSM